MDWVEGGTQIHQKNKNDLFLPRRHPRLDAWIGFRGEYMDIWIGILWLWIVQTIELEMNVESRAVTYRICWIRSRMIVIERVMEVHRIRRFEWRAFRIIIGIIVKGVSWIEGRWLSNYGDRWLGRKGDRNTGIYRLTIVQWIETALNVIVGVLFAWVIGRVVVVKVEGHAWSWWEIDKNKIWVVKREIYFFFFALSW